MTAVNGYYYYEGEKISYNENFNPFEPTDDCEKITIEKTDGNKYTVTHYEYYSGTWRRYDSENFYLEGNNMIPESMEGVDVSTAKILEASSDRLVIETTGADEYGSFYDKYTYTRMAE
ncbi:lipocalin family protein [Phocaeicola coprocola]|nr:lipocalin family protein [Phocaeicola coprocola]